MNADERGSELSSGVQIRVYPRKSAANISESALYNLGTVSTIHLFHLLLH